MQVTRETLYIRRKPAFKENGRSEENDKLDHFVVSIPVILSAAPGVNVMQLLHVFLIH